MLINGELVSSISGQVMDSINPATEEIIGTVPLANVEDVNLAVESSLKAFPAWSTTSIQARALILRKLAARFRERKEEIAKVESLDTGNPLHLVRQDVEKSAMSMEYYAGIGYEMTGRTVPGAPGNLHFSVREPYGVCGRIVAFNHPFLFAAARIAAPLIAGNTVVLKPAEQSPLSAGILAEILQEIVPPGVVNLVTGNGKTGEAIVQHPQILRISFTGSVSTGLLVQQSAVQSGKIKNITLELGGKNPFILFPDADWEKAVTSAVDGMNFSWQGQSCGSTSRLMVHESIYDKTVKAIVDKVSKIRVGDPMSEDTNMGPINSLAHYNKVLGYIEEGVKEGAELVFGGEKPKGMSKGYWLLPTVFANVDASMKIAKEEIFGPVLSIMKWSTEDEVIQMANNSEFGLSAAVWTQDVKKAVRVSQKLESGYVWVNGSSVHYPQLPFGGYKQSGIGREEGVEELLSYTQLKSIHFIN